LRRGEFQRLLVGGKPEFQGVAGFRRGFEYSGLGAGKLPIGFG
jgi:hypothetical protein